MSSFPPSTGSSTSLVSPKYFDQVSYNQETPIEPYQPTKSLYDNKEIILPYTEELTEEAAISRFRYEVASPITGGCQDGTKDEYKPDKSDLRNWFEDSLDPIKKIAEHFNLSCGLEKLSLKIEGHNEKKTENCLFFARHEDSLLFRPKSFDVNNPAQDPGVNKVLSMISELHPTSSLMLLFNSSEALVVQKQENGSLSICLVNTGEENLKFHKRIQTKNGPAFSRSLKFTELKPKDLTDSFFWEKLLGCSITDKRERYKLCLRYLSLMGKPVLAPEKFPEFFTRPQAFNNPFNVLFSTLGAVAEGRADLKNSGLEESRHFHKRQLLFNKVRSTVLITRRYLDKGVFDRSQHSLITKTLPFLTKRLNKAFASGAIDSECHGTLSDTLIDIEARMREAKDHYIHHEKAPTLPWSPGFEQLDPVDAEGQSLPPHLLAPPEASKGSKNLLCPHSLERAQALQSIEEVHTDKKEGVLSFLNSIHETLQHDDDTIPISVKADFVARQLRLLKPPQDNVWKQFHKKEEVDELGRLLNSIQNKLGTLHSQLDPCAEKGDIYGLSSSLLLTQSHLALIYFETLRHNEDAIRGYRLHLHELKLLPLLRNAWPSQKDRELFRSLCSYQRDLELNEGSDRYLEEVFSSRLQEPASLCFRNFDTLKSLRIVLANSFCLTQCEAKYENHSPQGAINEKFTKARNSLTGGKALGETFKILIDDLQMKKRSSESQFIYDRIRESAEEQQWNYTDIQLQAAECAGAGGSLLYLERFIETYIKDPSRFKKDDVLRALHLVMSNPYIDEQFQAQPQLLDRVRERLKHIKKDCCSTERYTLFFSILQLEARLVMAATAGQGQDELRNLAEEAFPQRSCTHPIELKDGPLCALAILAEIPVDQWTHRERNAFFAYFRAYSYMTGEQIFSTLPPSMNERLSYLYHFFCKEIVECDLDSNKELNESLKRALAPLLQVSPSYAPKKLTLEEPHLKIDGMFPGPSQLGTLEQVKKFLCDMERKDLHSLTPDGEVYRALDLQGNTYFIHLESIEGRTHFQLRSEFEPPEAESKDKSKAEKVRYYHPQKKAGISWIIDNISERLSIDSRLLTLAVPADGKGPCYVFKEGKRILCLEKRDEHYDLRNLRSYAEPKLYLREKSQIPSVDEEEVKDSELRLKDLVHALGDPVIIWSDEDNKLTRLEAPRLGLTFDSKYDTDTKSFRLELRGSNGFYLSSDQHTRLKEIIPGGILLENRTGEQKEEKLLILSSPHQKAPEKKGFKPEVTLTNPMEAPSATAYRLMDIRDEHGERTLVPQSYSECLELCHTFAQQKKYKLLKTYLGRLTLSSALSKEQRESLRELLNTLYEHKGPEAQALTLALFAHCKRAEHFFPGQRDLVSSEVTRKIKTVFEKYLEGHKPISRFALSPEDQRIVEIATQFERSNSRLYIPPIKALSRPDLEKFLKEAGKGLFMTSKKAIEYKLDLEKEGSHSEQLAEEGKKSIELMVKNKEDYYQFSQFHNLISCTLGNKNKYGQSGFWAMALACHKYPESRQTLRSLCIFYRSLIGSATKESELGLGAKSLIDNSFSLLSLCGLGEPLIKFDEVSRSCSTTLCPETLKNVLATLDCLAILTHPQGNSLHEDWEALYERHQKGEPVDDLYRSRIVSSLLAIENPYEIQEEVSAEVPTLQLPPVTLPPQAFSTQPPPLSYDLEGLNDLKKNLDEHLKRKEQLTEKLKNPKESLETLSTAVEEEENIMREELQKLYKTIMSHACTHRTQDRALNKLAKNKQHLTFSELRQAWLEHDITHYRQLLNQPDEVIELIDQLLWQHTMLKTHCQELYRLRKSLDESRETPEEERTPFFLNDLIDNFNAQLNYPLSNDFRCRMYLHMEGERAIRLRENQTRFIDAFISYCIRGDVNSADVQLLINELQEKKHTKTTAIKKLIIRELLAELGTGSGKSKVLIPLMEYALFQLKNHSGIESVLSGVVWPTGLFQRNVEDSSKDLLRIFGRGSLVLQMTREDFDLCDPEKIDIILSEVKTAIEKGHTLHLPSMARKTLHLKHIAYLNEIEELKVKIQKSHYGRFAHEERISRIRSCLPKIATLQSYFSQGYFTQDESQITQDPTSGNLQFAEGEKRALPHEYGSLITGLFEQLSIIEKLDIAHNNQKKSLEQGFNYKKETIPALVAYANQHIAQSKHLEGNLVGSLKKYLSSPDEESIPEELKALPEDTKQLIYLARGLIHKTIPFSLRKEANLHFGYSKITKDEITSIPLRSADDPSEGSEFESILLTSCLSCINKIYSGTNALQTQALAKLLLKDIHCEVKFEKTVPVNTETWKNCVLPCFGDIKYKELQEIAKGERAFVPPEEESATLKSQRALLFLKRIGIQQIRYYEKKIYSSPQTNSRLCGNLVELSATLGPNRMYGPPDAITSFSVKDEKERAKENLKQKARMEGALDKEHFISSKHAQDVLSTKILNDTTCYMFVDAGAELKGIPPEQVARDLMLRMKEEGKRTDIDAIEFFIDDETYVITRNCSEPIPSDLCKFSKKRRLRYCDHAHRFGTDFDLPKEAKGLVTVSLSTSIDELLQACGRLRKLHKGQHVQLILEEELAKKIGWVNAEPESVEKLVNALFKYCEDRQKVLDAQKISLHLQQRATLTLERLIIKRLIPSSPAEALRLSSDEQIEIFNQAKHVLIKPSLPAFDQLFGGSLKPKGFLQSIEEHLALVEKDLRSIGPQPEGTDLISKDELDAALRELEAIKEEAQNLINTKVLPENPPASLENDTLEGTVESEYSSDKTETDETELSSKQQTNIPSIKHKYFNESEWRQDFLGYNIFENTNETVSQDLRVKKKRFFVKIEKKKNTECRNLPKEYFEKWVGRPQARLTECRTYWDKSDVRLQQLSICVGWAKLITASLAPLLLSASYLGTRSLRSGKWSLKRNDIIASVALFSLYWIGIAIKGFLSTRTVLYKKESYPGGSEDPLFVHKEKVIGSHSREFSPTEILFDKLKVETEKSYFSKDFDGARARLAYRYNKTVDSFFSCGYGWTSYFSKNLFNDGAFEFYQPEFESLLVIREDSKVRIIAGTASDRRQWQEILAGDRERYKAENAVSRERSAEVWSVSLGCPVDSCAKTAKDQSLSLSNDSKMQWECMKYKLFNGDFHLPKDELGIFKDHVSRVENANELDEIETFFLKLWDLKKQQHPEISDTEEIPLFKLLSSRLKELKKRKRVW